jgi:hypothetical protein
MRPTDKTRNEDLPRGRGDHATLYVSLELQYVPNRPRALGVTSQLPSRLAGSNDRQAKRLPVGS